MALCKLTSESEKGTVVILPYDCVRMTAPKLWFSQGIVAENCHVMLNSQ